MEAGELPGPGLEGVGIGGGHVLSMIPDTPVGTQVLAGQAHCLSSPLPYLASSPLPSAAN